MASMEIIRTEQLTEEEECGMKIMIFNGRKIDLEISIFLFNFLVCQRLDIGEWRQILINIFNTVTFGRPRLVDKCRLSAFSKV